MSTRNLRGWLPDVPDHRDRPFRLAAPKAAPPVADVSALLNLPPDQGPIGSCVGNSSTSAYEWLYRKLKGTSTDFSRLFTYYQARLLGGFPVHEDTGCYIRDAMRSLAKLGTCLERTWPYDVSKFALPPPPPAVAEAANYQALYYYRCLSLADIKASIGVDGYPVVGGFSVPESIYGEETTRTGVVRFPGVTEKIIGGHAVIFVGYSDAKRLLRFQNSWGPAWGSAGYGDLPYDFIERGLADDFWTVRSIEIPAPPAPPVPPAPRPSPKPRPVVRRRGIRFRLGR